MAEDFQVKQNSSGSPLYGLTGTALGGVGTYYALNHFTKPKYGSYEEILAEAQDSFDSKFKNAAEGEETNFLNEAKALREKKVTAENKYQTDFEAFKAADKEVETKELQELNEKLKNAADDKKSEIQKEIDKLVADKKDKIKLSELPAEEQEKEFVKTLGENIKDKKAYIDKELEEAKNTFTGKYAEKLKRKWGFAEHFGWKIGAATAAGALIVGAIASALAPKNN